MDPITLDHLAVWQHTPKKKPKARVLIIHGISEHSGRHLNTVDALNANGYEAIRFDLRGAGRSGGVRQWVDRFSDYVDDTAEVANWIHRELDPLPFFVLGHSMGGAVAIYFTAHYQSLMQGLILSAPAYLAGDSISKLLIAVGKVAVFLTPNLRIPKSSAPTDVSRDPAVVEAYLKDPLACHFNTLRQGNELLKAMKKIPDEITKLSLPILFLHGTSDTIVKMQGSFELVRNVASSDKILQILPNVFHEPHNDYDKQAYFDLVTRWIRNHI